MKRVKIDDNVLTLLENVNIDMNSDSPQISSKRPFGNSSYYRDVLKKIGAFEEYSNDHGEITEEGEDIVEDYLERTKVALEILCQNHNIQTGVYMKEEGVWKMPLLPHD